MNDDFITDAEARIVAFLRSARPELMQFFGKVDYTSKADRTVVTHLDKQLEQQLRELLRTIDPGIGIEGEEFAQEGSRKTYWLVDPIDGTEQFIRGIPSCRTQICLIDNGQVIWSLIYFFVRDEFYLARRGKGAVCNGDKIQIFYRPLNRSWIDVTSALSDSEFTAKIIALRPHIANFGGFHDLSLMFTGKIDGLISFMGNGSSWDYAPRSLLYQEAGAKIANFGSDSYDYTNPSFLVAHPQNFDKLMSILSRS